MSATGAMITNLAGGLNLFLKQGMTRWCMPVELSREWLSDTLTDKLADERADPDRGVHFILCHQARITDHISEENRS